MILKPTFRKVLLSTSKSYNVLSYRLADVVRVVLLCWLSPYFPLKRVRTSISLLSITFRFTSLTFGCWFFQFPIVGALATVFIRLDSNLPSTVRIVGPNVTALSITKKSLHHPVHFGGFKFVRILLFCSCVMFYPLSCYNRCNIWNSISPTNNRSALLT